jgi:hypothetical protein
VSPAFANRNPDHDPFQAFDALLIAPFRLLPNPEAGFYFGVCVLALASAALGWASKALVAYAHRVRRTREDGEAKRQRPVIQAAQPE